MKQYDDLVIGSGISGMTLSLLLARSGRKVLLLEKSRAIGGSMQRFRRNGIPFDTGFHFTTALKGCMGDMIRMLGYEGELQTDPIASNFYLADQKHYYRLPHGRDRIQETLCRYFPEDESKIRAYFQLEKDIFNSTPVFHLEKSVFEETSFRKEDEITLKEYLDSMKASRDLRSILAGFVTCHGTPCGEISLANHCRVSCGLLDDLVRVRGSGGAFIEAFRKQAKTLGIEIRTGCTIAQCLETERARCRKVLLTDGTEAGFEDCIMTIHPHAIIPLLPEQYSKGIFMERLEDFEESCGFFTVFAVLEKECPSFHQELTSYFSTSDINDIMTPEHPEATVTGIMLSNERGLDGKIFHTVSAFENVFREETKRWEGTTTGNRGPEYLEYKKRKCDAILKKIYELYPEFKGSLKILDSASMLTYRDYLSPYGSAYGIRQKTGQLNLFGKLPIRNFYAAGQNALLPGAMGAMLSAFIIWRKVVGEEVYMKKLAEARKGIVK